MNGDGKDRRVVSKDSRRAVSMMYVRIYDHRFFHRAVRLQFSNRNGHIMNRAESFTVARISVMKSAAEIRTEPVAQRRLPRENGSTRRQPHRLDEFRRVW